MAREHISTHSLADILSSAVEFGLTPDDVWETVMAAPDRLPTDLRARYIDELTGELARRLLEKERPAQDSGRPTPHRPASKTLRKQLVLSSAVTAVLIVVVILAGGGSGSGLAACTFDQLHPVHSPVPR
jgi:hypothetical protein